MENQFKALGRKISGPSRDLETFAKPEHVTCVRFTSRELTCSCPVTGQPDYYALEIVYHPDARCLESKSLKLYLWSYRDQTMFAETLAHSMARDIQAATQALYCKVSLTQNVRGGLELSAIAEVGTPALPHA